MTLTVRTSRLNLNATTMFENCKYFHFKCLIYANWNVGEPAVTYVVDRDTETLQWDTMILIVDL